MSVGVNEAKQLYIIIQNYEMHNITIAHYNTECAIQDKIRSEYF